MKSAITITSPSSPAIRTARHRGEEWFGGELGQAYEIQIHNLTYGSILAVVTVDGKDTMSGEPGSYDGGGMVIRSLSTVTIKGWRTSTEAVASFEITSVAGSYVAKTGDASNVGVVGVAIFEEKPAIRMPAMRPVARPACAPKGITRGGATFGSAGAGTGFGEIVSSPVTMTTFERAHPTRASEVHVLRYDTTANLIEAGILTDDSRRPNPFPANADGFCKAP